MDEKGIGYKDAAFYSHMLPSLDSPGWKKNRLAGDGWLAVGDAGGLVDPITGEGLYYAMRSGDLASQVVLNDAHSPAEKAQAYRGMLRRGFRRGPGIRGNTRQARLPGTIPVQQRARPNGWIRSPQPALPRSD